MKQCAEVSNLYILGCVHPAHTLGDCVRHTHASTANVLLQLNMLVGARHCEAVAASQHGAVHRVGLMCHFLVHHV